MLLLSCKDKKANLFIRNTPNKKKSYLLMWQIGFFILLIQFLILTVLALILRHNLLHDLHNRHNLIILIL